MRQTALPKHVAASTQACGPNTASMTPITGRPASVAVTREAVKPMGSTRFQNGLRLALFCADSWPGRVCRSAQNNAAANATNMATTDTETSNESTGMACLLLWSGKNARGMPSAF